MAGILYDVEQQLLRRASIFVVAGKEVPCLLQLSRCIGGVGGVRSEYQHDGEKQSREYEVAHSIDNLEYSKEARAGGPCLMPNFIKLRVPMVPRFWGPGMLNWRVAQVLVRFPNPAESTGCPVSLAFGDPGYHKHHARILPYDSPDH